MKLTNLNVLSAIVVFGIVLAGAVFVFTGCDEEQVQKTAVSNQSDSTCPIEAETTACPLKSGSAECKANRLRPEDCKKECCEKKKAAGTCPLMTKSVSTSEAKTCSGKSVKPTCSAAAAVKSDQIPCTKSGN